MDIREPEVDAKMFYDDALSPLCSGDVVSLSICYTRVTEMFNSFL